MKDVGVDEQKIIEALTAEEGESCLTKVESVVLAEYVGFNEEQQTLYDIAEKHNISRELVRQIIVKALKKIQGNADTVAASTAVYQGYGDTIIDQIIDIIKATTTGDATKIIISRFGLEDGVVKNIEELQKLFPQYTCEQIKVMEKDWLNKLRNK